MGCCDRVGQLLCVVVAHAGLLLSGYALYVERVHQMDPKYRPICDINDQMSCSRVFNSKHATGFGVVGDILGPNHLLNQPNSVYGIIFYTLMSIMSVADSRSVWLKLQWLLTTLALVSSCHLAYVLVYVLHTTCVVCVALYAVNLVLFLLTLTRCCCCGGGSSASVASAGRPNSGAKSAAAKGANKKRAKRD